MRTLNYKTMTHMKKEKMRVIYKDLLESFKHQTSNKTKQKLISNTFKIS